MLIHHQDVALNNKKIDSFGIPLMNCLNDQQQQQQQQTKLNNRYSKIDNNNVKKESCNSKTNFHYESI